MPVPQVIDMSCVPRIPMPNHMEEKERPAINIVNATHTLEGEGFEVRRAFTEIEHQMVDPFILLDHMGSVEYSPGEAKGAPDHPHRGFETVTYMIDGELEHRDSNGGGGIIKDGATQWMTAGSGIIHSEMPTEGIVTKGGLFHGVQLWVNLPRTLKWSPPQYQDVEAHKVTLLASQDSGAILRVIGGEVCGYKGPSITRTPVSYVHATIFPGARLEVPWPKQFNALIYVMTGSGTIGQSMTPLKEGQLAILGHGDYVSVSGDSQRDSLSTTTEMLLLGGTPINEPIYWYGPFVMNTRNDIVEAMEDYQSGRMGHIPAKISGV